MIRHVHDALDQIRSIHRHMVEKQRFKGYSGRARAAAGCLALLGSVWLARFPGAGPNHQLLVWGAVAAGAIAINYGAVLIWFFANPAEERKAEHLKPLLENLPALGGGALLTYVLVRDGVFQDLPGMWMLLFGLANLASRRVLTRGIGWVGTYYVAAGTAFLIAPPSTPWPMGLVFFAGEWAGGFVLHYDREPKPTWASFWGLASHVKSDEQTN
ncbi:MAG TPA: hypothetical protein VHE61_11065 [Opitutaceae bacterium]|nr:hypothetical protein [Opitutaceae bacterium]